MGEWFEQHWPIPVGVVIGALAHFGHMISAGKMPTWRETLGFAMQLGLVTLLAAVVAVNSGIADDLNKCLLASALTVSTNEVFNWVRRRWKAVAEASGLGGTENANEHP